MVSTEDFAVMVICGFLVGVGVAIGVMALLEPMPENKLCHNTWPGSFERGGKCVQAKEVE
jgi:hypothetical protein